MKRIEVAFNDNIDKKEFCKVVGFLSEHILEYKVLDEKLILKIDDELDEKEIISDIKEFSRNYTSNNDLEKTIYENKVKLEKFYDEINSIHYFDDGMFSLSRQALFLFEYFESSFCGFINNEFADDDCDIVHKIYPVLLPVSAYKKTGYLKRTPQYAIFCCSACENMKILKEIDKIDNNEYKSIVNNPNYALSPSACFHVYEELKDKVLPNKTIVTFTQSVFRNEGRFNFKEFGRMRDYHVREIVFIGDEYFVESTRERLLEATKNFVNELQLDAKITIASDPFILPRMQKFKKVQAVDRSKYELRLSYNSEEDMSVASFNLHGTAFTSPFNIKVNNADTVTGCVGYGLERFVLAFLSQYGENVRDWPEQIKKEYKSKDIQKWSGEHK